MYASESNDVDLVELLINYGGNYEIKNNHGYNSIDIAKLSANDEIFE